MNKIQEFLKKKIFGVPIIYLAGAGALILAYLAYRTKAATTPAVTDPNAVDGTNPSGADASTNGVADAYSGLATNGTVVVAPQTPTTADVVVETNETWGHSAIQYLIDQNVPPGDAQTAITLYLQGANLSYDQGHLRDLAIKKLGIPPDALETIGTVSGKPARKQILTLPGYHTVETSNDNTFPKISTLEYGVSDNNHVDEIVSANAKSGGRDAVLAIGTRIYVPVYHNPQYFTATGGYVTPSAIAKKFNTNAINIEVYNPTLSFPVPQGTKVRVG